MQDDGLDATLVKSNGWRQGSILSDVLVDELREAKALPELIDDSCKWIVISHDCDVTNESFDREPTVELIPGRLLAMDELDGNKNWMKNTRVLQFDSDNLSATLEFDPQNRFTIDRRYLASSSPIAEQLEPANVLMLATWIAKRYRRAAFPDNFNSRTQKAVSKIRKKAKKKGKWITGLYVLVSDEELPPEKDYGLIVLATMKREDHDDPERRKEAVEFAGTVEACLAGSDGIDLKTIELRSEADVSLEELNLLKRWDFDDLTAREDGVRAIPDA